jgi:membrane protease YdiL (CAAX protease family)
MQPESEALSPRRLVRLALVFYAALGAAAVAWRVVIQGQSLWMAPGASVRWLRDPALGALAAAIVILASAHLSRRSRVGARLARSLAERLGPLAPHQCWILAVASGLAEEAFFRGALQPAIGLVAASAVFAAAHFVPRRELMPWSGFSLAAGLLLGWLFQVTGNLTAPVVAHVLVNGVNLNRLVREHAGAEPAP